MMLRKRSLKNCKLYLVLDTSVADYERLLTVADDAISAGVDIVQLRDKESPAKTILEVGRKLKNLINGRVPLIINDRVDLALAIQSDGVHLGQEDMPLYEARRILGDDCIIGLSCQNIVHLKKAHEQGADYVGFGSIYKTETKPDRQAMDSRLLGEALKAARIPLFAIGGINKDNLEPLIAWGVQRIAVTRAIINADNLQRETRAFKEMLSDMFCESSSVAEH